MSHKDHYNQYVGKDTWRDSETQTTGKAEYDKDGTLRRLDIYGTSPDSKHDHTWLVKQPDGTYKHCHEKHENHKS